MKKLIFLCLAFALSISLNAQQNLVPLNFELQDQYESLNNKLKQPSFSFQKPFIASYFDDQFDLDSLKYGWERDQQILSKFKHPKWWRKLRNEDIISYKKHHFILKVNPLLNFSTGKSDLRDDRLMVNTRGVDISGSFSSNFSFGTGVYENQAVFPDFYNAFIVERKVIPGQGRARVFNENGYDYSQAYGYVSISPSKMFNLQLGHGKQFIGSGYRSLILSDNAFNMPYFKLSSTWKRVRYTNLLMALQNTLNYDGTKEIASRRFASYTSVDFLIGKYIELGLTEAIVWSKNDSLSISPSSKFYNPLILYHTFEFGLQGESPNILLGFNAKVKWSKSLINYGQIVVDNDQISAFQVGLKWYEVFNSPLFIQMEFNSVKSNTYSHQAKLSFSHFNQEMAHPYGANFKEILLRTRYKLKDFIFSYQFSYSNQVDDYTRVVFQQKEINVDGPMFPVDHSFVSQVHQFRIAYLVNSSANLQIYFEYNLRKIKPKTSAQTEAYYMWGLRTNLVNKYQDL